MSLDLFSPNTVEARAIRPRNPRLPLPVPHPLLSSWQRKGIGGEAKVKEEKDGLGRASSVLPVRRGQVSAAEELFKTSLERTSLRKRPPGGPSSRLQVLNARQRQQGALQAAASAGGENQREPWRRQLPSTVTASHRPVGSPNEVLLGPGEPQKMASDTEGRTLISCMQVEPSRC